MTINERIRAAIRPIVPRCVPGDYNGAETEYCTFDYDSTVAMWADGEPWAIQYEINLHWYLPTERNPIRKMDEIAAKLVQAGFPEPDITEAGNNISQHYIFEFEAWEFPRSDETGD